MSGSKLLCVAVAAWAVALGGPTPALAQCRLCETPTMSREDPANRGDVALEIDARLDFDRLILGGQGDGAAILRPDGSRTVEGAVTELSPRAMVGAVTVRGEPNRVVRVELPRRIQLYSVGGGQISFEDVVSDAPSLPRLDSSGKLTFRFGGRLQVTGDAEGDYRGELPITVEYP